MKHYYNTFSLQSLFYKKLTNLKFLSIRLFLKIFIAYSTENFKPRFDGSFLKSQAKDRSLKKKSFKLALKRKKKVLK